MSVKRDILNNPFVEKIREGAEIDRLAFELLCTQLKALQVQWKDEPLIDKELMQEIYFLPWITKAAADRIRPDQPSKADEIEEMYITLDALILECLS